MGQKRTRIQETYNPAVTIEMYLEDWDFIAKVLDRSPLFSQEEGESVLKLIHKIAEKTRGTIYDNRNKTQ